MGTTRKALEINGEIHGTEIDDYTREIVKDYGIVVPMGKCPCQYNAHQVKGPCFWLNPHVVQRRGGRGEGTVDVLIHDGTYCLPENQGKWWCNRDRAIGEAARKFLDKKIGFKDFEQAVSEYEIEN